jgi:hypothetical protein
VVKAGKLTEKQFMAQVVKLATLCGWRVPEPSLRVF